MSLSTTKTVQAYIQALNEVVVLLKQADVKAQAYKALFVSKNPDLSGTNITQAQINAVNTFISDLNTLANGAVATTIQNKNIPSHGTTALN